MTAATIAPRAEALERGIGAVLGPLLAGALLVVGTRAEPPVDTLGFPAFLLYTVSVLIGLDLTAGTGVREGVVLRLAGYLGGHAVAVGLMAGGFAVCNALGVLEDSSLWDVATGVCPVGAPVGRAAVRGLARGLDTRPGALLAGSVLLALVAWFGVFATMMAYMVRIDA